LGGTFTFAGAFALNMNWHKGDAYSSAKERKELASELIDSILAEEMKPVPEWKKELT
jgi:hypothetical protein